MKFGSIGIRAAWRSSRKRRSNGRAGFTLLEALVALALVLAFASVIGPHLSQARRIMANAEGRLAAQVLLRSLLDAPFDRSSLARASREGTTNGLNWRVVAEPAAPVIAPVTRAREQANWSAFRITASVTWAPDQAIMAETIRLGKP
jgi:prepilin-type N-terminal cleavage/methylation domain-containing protein